MLIGEKLEFIRKKFGIQSQTEMAKSLGLEQGSYSDIVRGKTKKISGPIARLLEIQYQVNIDSLSDETQGSDTLFTTKKHMNVLMQVAEDQAGYTTKQDMEIKLQREIIDALRESNELYKEQIVLLREKSSTKTA